MPSNFIVKFLTKGSLNSIIDGKFDGIERDYLISDKNKILRYAINLKNKIDCSIFLEVKYQFGFRDKRIEIVLNQGNIFALVKIISDNAKLDQEVLNLDNIITDIKKNTNINIDGLIIAENKIKPEVIESIKSIITNDFTFLDLNELKDKNTLGEILCHI